MNSLTDGRDKEVVLDDCLAKADYKNFPARLSKSLGEGKARGIGISNTVASTNFGLIEHAELRFDPTGSLTLSLGTQDHGQGHATSFRQIIADKLGIPPERVRFQQGDIPTPLVTEGEFTANTNAVHTPKFPRQTAHKCLAGLLAERAVKVNQ